MKRDQIITRFRNAGGIGIPLPPVSDIQRAVHPGITTTTTAIGKTCFPIHAIVSGGRRIDGQFFLSRHPRPPPFRDDGVEIRK